MYNDLVKRLLEKHFGPAKKSLTLGDAAEDMEAEADDGVYYYAFGKEKEIVAIRDLLAGQSRIAEIESFPELRQAIPGDSGDCETGDGSFLCVQLRETGDSWYVAFFTVTGVSYHRTYGNRVAATLLLDRFPVVSLSDGAADPDFYGFWTKLPSRKPAPYLKRDGFSYWMNKALRRNPGFRDFAADFFSTVGEAEKKYILKDVARTIRNCGCFMPDISYPDLLQYRTPSALMHRFFEADPDLQVDFNKVDLNAAYAMIRLAGSIDRRDWKILTGLGAEAISDVITLKIFYDGFSAGEFVRSYYVEKLGRDPYDSETRMYAEDYVEMSLELGEPMRLCYDKDGLIRAHDALSVKVRMKANEKEFRLALVREPSRFDELETRLEAACAGEFERIRTTERLFAEGEAQHNCVFSRRTLIRNDRAAVFHWNHNGRSYTIQFAIGNRGSYYLDEIRARFNAAVTECDWRDLQRMLEGICTVGEPNLHEIPEAD